MKLNKNDILNLFIICLYFIAHFYIIWHLNYGLRIPFPYNHIIAGVILLLGIISIMTLIAIKFETPFLTRPHRAGNSWMGIFAITVVCFIVNDIINLFYKAENFRYYSTLVTVGVDIVLCVWSGLNVGFFLRVKTLHVGIEDFKAEKLKIAFIADMHIDKYTSFRKVNKIVDRINSIKPDIILFGGDIIDNDTTKNYHLYGLEKLDAKYGMFAVTGNHEYHLGIEKFLEFCTILGVKVLRNESVAINGMLNIAGINDDFGEKIGIDEADIKKAFEKVDASLPTIFLSHKPDVFPKAVKENKSPKLIQLSGHTHGGQIPPMGIIGSIFFKYYYGKAEKENAVLYITSGAGWWGPPMRLFNISEIAEIVLFRKEKK